VVFVAAHGVGFYAINNNLIDSPKPGIGNMAALLDRALNHRANSATIPLPFEWAGRIARQYPGWIRQIDARFASGVIQLRWDLGEVASGFSLIGFALMHDTLNGSAGIRPPSPTFLPSSPHERNAMFESLENRQMFSATIDTNIAPSQSVGPVVNVNIGPTVLSESPKFHATCSTGAHYKAVALS
jgi:hypothetical protein